MPRPLRAQFAGAYYHIFNRGVNKQAIFFDDRDRLTFFRILGDSVSKYTLRIFAYCLMDNHFHLFLQTIHSNIGQSMRMLQSQYAQYINVKYGRIGGLFQDRYKSELVEKDSYSLTLVRYIHLNPVESNAVLSPEDYPWSSYSSYTKRGQKYDWLDTSWILNQFHENNEKIACNLFVQFHLQKGTEGSDPSVPF